MISLKSTLPLAVGVALMVTSSVASAANVLVVRSAGPSAKNYPAGKTLPDSAKIALQLGDSLTLLSANSMRTLRGPGTFSAASTSAASLAMAANRRARFGALRSGTLPKNPSPWDIDVSSGGNVCVANPAALMLWRPSTEEAMSVSIKGPGGDEQTLDWAPGKATVAWPTQLPVTDGAEYLLEWSGSSEVTKVNFIKLASAPQDVVGTAQTLIDKGCDRQVEALVKGVEKEEAE